MHRTTTILFMLFVSLGYGQYHYKGKLKKHNGNKTVYLSVVNDYRRISKIYVEHIISSTQTDSLGIFQFKGDNLPMGNGMYRIHTDGCTGAEMHFDQFSGNCDNSKSVLFIANNKDTVSFPTTMTNETLCSITSTNDKSDVFLKIDELKNRMLFDFSDFRSEANRAVNSEKWFKTFQEYGESLDEPLAEIYIYDFLSDKRNETFQYYLEDLVNNDYYHKLLLKLKKAHPNARFTQLYEAEITSDKYLASLQNNTGNFRWDFLLVAVLILSLIGNVYLVMRQGKTSQANKKQTLLELTQQERKILELILQHKTNKEIASKIFVSVSTVKTHINSLYKKLKVSSREELKTVFSRNSTQV
ncbi:MAG: helix-turn-helix transcriptional regulator [Bacteroidota bacterium]